MLKSEHETCLSLYERIGSYYNTMFNRPNDFLVEKYKRHHCFVFLRIEIIENELKKRKKLRGQFNKELRKSKLVDGNLNFPFSISDVARDAAILSDILSEFPNIISDNVLKKYLDYENNFQELNNLLKLAKEENFG